MENRLRDNVVEYRIQGVDLMRMFKGQREAAREDGIKRMRHHIKDTHCADCSNVELNEMRHESTDSVIMQLSCRYGTRGVVCPDEHKAMMMNNSPDAIRGMSADYIIMDELNSPFPYRPERSVTTLYPQMLMEKPRPKDEPRTADVGVW